MNSLEKIAKIRAKMSEINSTGSQNSQRNRSLGRPNETYDYDTYEESQSPDHDQVIVEADENLEATGPHDPYHNYKPSQYSKTPNIKQTKNLNSSKIHSLQHQSPDVVMLKHDNSMPTKMNNRDPFMNKVK